MRFPITRSQQEEHFPMELLLELGEPERSFHVWPDGVGTEGGFICESERGFLKWILHPPESEFVRHNWFERGDYLSNEAQVHFTGKRIDGTVFASTQEDGIPLKFIVGAEDVMHGFSMAVSSMQAGEKAVFLIPPELACTEFLIPWNVPRNQALRFDIELISHVILNDITYDGGILKWTIKRGTGYHEPCGFDEVIVDYNVCTDDGVSVSMSKGVQFSLAKDFFCPAFAHGVKTMREGEEAIFIVKPKYGFGEEGRPSVGNEAAVPPDTTLHVYIQLMSWTTVSHLGKDKTIVKKILRRGDSGGEVPKNQAVVRVRLIGKLQDGTVFDHRGSHEGDEPFEFIVDEEQVSDVLEEAVMTMREGEVALLTIPPPLVVVPPGCSVTYKIELVSVVNEKDPCITGMSRADSIETAVMKEKEGDKLFSSSKFLRAYRRYYKANWILGVHIIQKRANIVDEILEPDDKIYEELDGEDGETDQMPRELDDEDICEETDVDKIDEETDEEICEETDDEEPVGEVSEKGEATYKEEIDKKGIDEEIKQMLISITFKAAECATQLQCCPLAKGCYTKILYYDPKNVKAQQLAGQLFPEDSIGIDIATMHWGLWQREPAHLPPSDMRIKQGREKLGYDNLLCPPIRRPGANVPTATGATSRATTGNKNQNSGTNIAPPAGGPSVPPSSDGVSGHGISLAELKRELDTK